MIKDILKEETKLLHAETEKSLNAKRMFAADFRVDEYVEILQILYMAHVSLEQQLENLSDPVLAVFCKDQYSPHYPLIKRDLDHHGSSTETDTMLQKIETNDLNALGILYVLKGSSMGAKYIYKQLQDTAGNIFSTEFYKFSASQTMEEWKSFCESLEDLDLTPEETNQVVDGAKLAFKTFIHASEEIRKG